jgi:hypothetical protein
VSDPVSVAFVVQTAALVVATLSLAYPLVAYGHNVAHTDGLAFLTGTLVATTASYVAFSVFHLGLVSAALDLTAALSLAAAMWAFARPFVWFDDAGPEPSAVRGVAESPPDEPTGRFESAEE